MIVRICPLERPGKILGGDQPTGQRDEAVVGTITREAPRGDELELARQSVHMIAEDDEKISRIEDAHTSRPDWPARKIRARRQGLKRHRIELLDHRDRIGGSAVTK